MDAEQASADGAFLIDIEALDPAVVFAAGGAEPVLEAIERLVRDAPTDIETVSGRKVIRSLAFKIGRLGPALDEVGKTYVDDLKKRAKVVDGERRALRDGVADMRDKVRKPLTDWETAEERRINDQNAKLAEIEGLATFEDAEPTAAAIRERLDRLERIGGNWDWQEFANRAAEATQKAMLALTQMWTVAEKREADRKELEELRLKTAANDKRENERKIAEAAVAAAAQAVEDAARRKVQDKLDQAARDTEAAQAAAKIAEDGRLAAVAQAEKERLDAAAAAEAATAAAVEAERLRRKKADDAIEAANEARAADKAHRKRINSAALAALMEEGLPEELGKAAIMAIVSGKVPHITINY